MVKMPEGNKSVGWDLVIIPRLLFQGCSLTWLECSFWLQTGGPSFYPRPPGYMPRDGLNPCDAAFRLPQSVQTKKGSQAGAILYVSKQQKSYKYHRHIYSPVLLNVLGKGHQELLFQERGIRSYGHIFNIFIITLAPCSSKTIFCAAYSSFGQGQGAGILRPSHLPAITNSCPRQKG